jgi:hypothetical protein
MGFYQLADSFTCLDGFPNLWEIVWLTHYVGGIVHKNSPLFLEYLDYRIGFLASGVSRRPFRAST